MDKDKEKDILRETNYSTGFGLKPKENINNSKPLFQINFDERIRRLKRKEKIVGENEKFRISYHIEKINENDVSCFDNKWKSSMPVNINSSYNFLPSNTNEFYKNKLSNLFDCKNNKDNDGRNKIFLDSNNNSILNNYYNNIIDPNLTYNKIKSYENSLNKIEHRKNQSMNNIEIDYPFPNIEYTNPIISNKISFNSNNISLIKKINNSEKSISNFKGFKNIPLGKKFKKEKGEGRIDIQQNLTKAVRVNDINLRNKLISKDKDKEKDKSEYSKEPIFRNNYINNSVKNEKKPLIENCLDYNKFCGKFYPIGERSIFYNNKAAYKISSTTRNLSEFFENFN